MTRLLLQKELCLYVCFIFEGWIWMDFSYFIVLPVPLSSKPVITWVWIIQESSTFLVHQLANSLLSECIDPCVICKQNVWDANSPFYLHRMKMEAILGLSSSIMWMQKSAEYKDAAMISWPIFGVAEMSQVLYTED